MVRRVEFSEGLVVVVEDGFGLKMKCLLANGQNNSTVLLFYPAYIIPHANAAECIDSGPSTSIPPDYVKVSYKRSISV